MRIRLYASSVTHNSRRTMSGVLQSRRAGMVQAQGLLDAADIQLHVPPKTVQRGDVFFGEHIGVGQRGDHGEGFRPTSRDGHLETHLAQGQRLGNPGILRLGHPLRPGRTRPGNQVIVVPQSSSLAKVTEATLVQPGANVHPAKHESRRTSGYEQ